MDFSEFAAALRFAAVAHKEGRRKGSRAPYINHPLRVVELLALARAEPKTIQAGALHDVLEETDLTPADLAQEIDLDVIEIVVDVTDPPELSNMVRLERKAAQASKYRTARIESRQIKLADAISNLEDLMETALHWDSEDALNYIEGAEILIEACRDASGFLAAIADSAVEKARKLFEDKRDGFDTYNVERPDRG